MDFQDENLDGPQQSRMCWSDYIHRTHTDAPACPHQMLGHSLSSGSGGFETGDGRKRVLRTLLSTSHPLDSSALPSSSPALAHLAFPHYQRKLSMSQGHRTHLFKEAEGPVPDTPTGESKTQDETPRSLPGPGELGFPHHTT